MATDCIKKLFKLKSPYGEKKSNELFLPAIKQSCVFHYEHNTDSMEEVRKFAEGFFEILKKANQ